MKTHFLFLGLLYSCFGGIYAQNSEYIHTYSDYLTTRVFIQNRQLRLSIRPLEDQVPENEITYQPNVASTLGFGLMFKKLGINLGVKLAQDNEVAEQQEKSNYIDLQIHSFGRKIAFDVYFQDYKGYFIQEPQKVFENWQDTLPPLRPDLTIFHTGGNIMYLANHKKFSYRALFIHDEHQRRSAGSFIVTASLNHTRISSDSSIIPSQTRIRFRDRSKFNRAHLYNFSVMPGYAHIFVLKKWYLSLSLSTNLGARYQRYGLKKRDKKEIVPSFETIGRANLGYNSTRFFSGIELLFNTRAANLAETNTQTTTSHIKFSVGYRFPTKFLKGYKSIWQAVFSSGKRDLN